MRILQDWNTFQWSRITLLSDPAAKLIRMKGHVFSDSTMCVGVSNPDPSNNWATKVGIGQPEKCNSFGTHSQVLPPESFEERFIFMSVFNDIEWTKKGNTETCLHNAKEVAAFANQFKPGHWCFLEPASVNTCWY